MLQNTLIWIWTEIVSVDRLKSAYSECDIPAYDIIDAPTFNLALETEFLPASTEYILVLTLKKKTQKKQIQPSTPVTNTYTPYVSRSGRNIHWPKKLCKTTHSWFYFLFSYSQRIQIFAYLHF